MVQYFIESYAIIKERKGISMAYQPLADALRPQSIGDVVGQEHILQEGSLLRRIIESGTTPNLVFYGPSGTGKTTVANLIAKESNRTLRRLNATTASLADIKVILEEIGTMMAPNGILLYLDEIQYFTKKQQQSLLEVMERGDVTLIASTTENPYFYIYNAVLSRSTVFEFKPVESTHVQKALERALALMEERLSTKISCEGETLAYISTACGGDVRKAINSLELLISGAPRGEDGTLQISLADAQLVAQRSGMRYDREGDDHYDILSALQKSIRGSDPDGACHYLARLLVAGDLISACRRLMVIACEDIGLAYPQIIPIVKSCIDAANMVGLPEARIPLADAAVLMATAPKSNSAYLAINQAMADVRNGNLGNYPRHLQNVHADSAGLEQAQGYLYPHDYPNHWVAQQYLPDNLQDTQYYTYGDNKTEQAAKRYWDAIKE